MSVMGAILGGAGCIGVVGAAWRYALHRAGKPFISDAPEEADLQNELMDRRLAEWPQSTVLQRFPSPSLCRDLDSGQWDLPAQWRHARLRPLPALLRRQCDPSGGRDWLEQEPS